MRFFLFLFLLTLLFFSPAENAWACRTYENTEIVLKQIVTTPQINHKLQLAELMNKASSVKASDRFSSRHQQPVGLTAASLGLTAQYDIVTQRYPKRGYSCSQVKKLTLQYGYDDTVIYMARELPFPSCAYQEVLDHELRHVATDRSILGLYDSYLENLFTQLAHDIGVVKTRTDEEGKKYISQQINAMISQASQNMTQTRKKEQAKIDTDEEYARLGKVCRGAIPKIINHTLKRSHR